MLADLTWLTQLGFSLVLPLVLFLLGARWLEQRFLLGKWIYAVAVLLGLYTSASVFVGFARDFSRRNDKK